MPVQVTSNLRECRMKRGQLVIKQPKFRQVIIGKSKSPGMPTFKSGILISTGGRIIFEGRAVISQGTVLRCDRNAKIIIGDNFYCNCNCFLRSTLIIKVGSNCTFAWGITINTSDGHQVWHNGNKMSMQGPIFIGNHVWLLPECSLTKGVIIPDNCIVAQKAVVTKKFEKPNCIIGGIPAKVITENINWDV